MICEVGTTSWTSGSFFTSCLADNLHTVDANLSIGSDASLQSSLTYAVHSAGVIRITAGHALASWRVLRAALVWRHRVLWAVRGIESRVHVQLALAQVRQVPAGHLRPLVRCPPASGTAIDAPVGLRGTYARNNNGDMHPWPCEPYTIHQHGISAPTLCWARCWGGAGRPGCRPPSAGTVAAGGRHCAAAPPAHCPPSACPQLPRWHHLTICGCDARVCILHL